MSKEKILEDNGFISNNNYKLLYVDNGACEMEATITNSSMNPYGMIHGGFIFGLADTAAGIAAYSLNKKSVTVSSNINYLHALKGNKIKASAKCLKQGRNISVFEVSIYDEDSDKVFVKADVTYMSVD